MPSAITEPAPSTTNGVRHFTMPQPVEDRLYNITKGASVPNGPTDSKEITKQFTKEQQEPLKHSAPDKREKGITFAGQDNLPKLPIPELEQSVKRYLAALRPLQTVREHAETQQACEEFLKGEGPELQDKLRRYANGKTSYIEQFCKPP